jgi:TP901 family phage tail tape measure protein
MANSPNGLGNGIELKIILGVNDGASKDNLNTQIKDLQKKLDQVKIDIKIDPKAISALENLSKLDFSKLTQEFKNVGKEASKMATVTADELEKAMAKAAEITGVKLGKAIRGSAADIDFITKKLAGTNAKIKVDFDTVNGEKQLKKLQTSVETNGITQKVIFEKVSVMGDNDESQILWMPKTFQETNAQLSNAVKNTDELIAKMNKLQTEGKITNQQFEHMVSSIGKVDLNRANQMMDEMVATTKKQTKSLQEQEAEQERLIKNEQRRKSAILDVEKAMKTQSKTLNMDDANNLIGNLKGMDVASKNFNHSLKDNQLELKRMKTAAAEAGREQMGMMSMFKTAMEKFPIWMAASTIFFGITRGATDLTRKVIELDTAMVNLQRVMDLPEYKFNDMLEQSIVNVENLSGKLGDYMNLVAEFGRMGFDSVDTLDMSNTAQMLTNISDLTADESVSSLVAAMKAFNITAEESVAIADKLNEVDNQYSITTKDLAQSMNKSASTARVFGASLEELLGYTTAIGSATRESGNVVGNSLKTIMSRIMTMPQAATALSDIGISITDMEGQVRPVANVIDELGRKWNTLSSEEQQNTAIKVAGMHQLSRFNALMLNYGTAVDATTTAMNSQGSATREQEKYNQSLEARINRLSTAWYGLADSVGQSVLYDGIVVFTKSLEGATKVGDSAVASIGALPIVFGVIGASVALLSTRFSTWTGTLIANKAASLATTTANGSLSASLLGVAATSTVAQRALMMTGVGAALVVVGIGLSLFTSAISKNIQEQEEFEVYIKKNTDALGSNKIATEELIKQYNDLTQAKESGSWDSEKEEEYLAVQQKLGDSFPALVKSIDSTGQSHIKNKEAIEAEIKATEELIDAQNKSTIENANKEFEKLNEDLSGSWYESFSNFVYGSLESRIRQQKNILEAMYENDADNGATAEEELKLKQLERQFQQTSEEIKGHIFVIANAMSGIDISSNLSNMLQEFIGGLDFSKLDSSELETFSKEIGSIQEDLQNAINNGDQGAFDSIITKLNKLASETNGFDYEYGSLSATLENGNIALKNGSEIIQVLAEDSEDAADKVDELSEAFESAVSTISSLNSIVNELNEGNGLSAKSIQTMMEKYPQLLAYINDEATLREKISDLILQEKETAKEAMLAKLSTNKEIYTKMYSDNKAYMDGLAKLYNIDLKNAKNLAQAKELIESALLKSISKKWGEYYDVQANAFTEQGKALVSTMGYAEAVNSPMLRDIGNAQTAIKEISERFDNMTSDSAGLNSLSLGMEGLSNSTKDTSKETKEATYETDKYKAALERVNLEIEKQQILQAKFTEYSKQYRDSKQKEIKLEQEKMKILQQQSTELTKQIKSGKVLQTGKTSTSAQNLSGWNGTITGRVGDSRAGGTRSHRGIDIAQPMGTRLDANVGGKVIASGSAKSQGYDSSYGNIVVVQDKDGVKHLYAHLEKAIAKLGATIVAGTQIGNVGSTGHSTGSHLHYEQSKNGSIIDPTSSVTSARKGVASSAVGSTNEAIDQAKSNLNGLQGDLLAVQEAIANLELDIINSQLAEFDNTRESYQRVLDFENEKIQSLDESSKQYFATIERQAHLLENKQAVNKKELDYINALIKGGKLSARSMDEMKHRAQELKTGMMSLDNEISQLQETLNNFVSDTLSDIKDEYLDGLNKGLEQATKSIEDTIQSTEEYYDTLIEKQQERLDALDEEIEKEDRLKKLREIDDDINKVKGDKRFSYITAEGEEILTHDKSRLSELEKQRDELLQQYHREDIKKAIQDEINRLEEARNNRVKSLRKQLEDTKLYYDQLIQTEEAKWDGLIKSAGEGTLEFDTLMNEFYGSSLSNLQSYVGGIQDQIKSVVDAFASLSGMSGSIPSASKGGSSSNPLGMSASDFNKYTANKKAVGSGGSAAAKAHKENEALRNKYDIDSDKYSYNDLKKYHSGGIVGGGRTSRLSELTNKLFNTKPNEQIVKSLVGELQTPPNNIPNLFTNINSMLSKLTPRSNGAPAVTENNYHFNNMTVKTDSPSEFINDLKFLISSR